MAVGLAGLEEGIITPDFKVHCGGGANFYGRYFLCWKKGGHGVVDLRHAIEQSCDVYFYTVGNMLGVDRINKWATLLGLGVKSNIDLPNEVTGLVPSTQWKATQREKKWYAGETISVAIGQGQVSVTPVSLAVYTATLANGGTRVTPHLVQGHRRRGRLEGAAGAAAAVEDRRHVPRNCRPSATGCGWSSTPAGTGRRAQIPGHDVCGKTGTRAGDFEPGSASRRPRAARTCATTAGSCSSRRATIRRSPASSSSSTACTAPTPRRISHHILETYFAKKDGKPLPPPPTREDMRLDFSRPVRAWRGRPLSHVRTTAVLPRRLAAARRGAPALGRRHRDDLQHDLRDAPQPAVIPGRRS